MGIVDLLLTVLAVLGLALMCYAFFRSTKRLLPPEQLGSEIEEDPVQQAMRNASASGFDLQ